MNDRSTNNKAGRPADDARKPRSDGEQSRERLLMAAMRLFAERGFDKTPTREIALAAGANVAAISYYFGDKAGLYRAALSASSSSPEHDIGLFDQPHFTLRQSLDGFFTLLLEPMRQGETAQLCMRMWSREMLEPTGLLAEEIDQSIKPMHLALVSLLCRHLGVAGADDDMHRLAFAITGLGLQVMLGCDVIRAARPQLLDTPDAVLRWQPRLVGYAEAIVAAEQTRLRQGSI
ncbi:TetR/AcrR family transcriptional regulator, regulator of cefoperazone and chloramphenicol sensitivity [Janthinobacterium sp. CG_23.3]|uniref:CerR family C-terminal domain-containing protein n=1 Tax=unclassified Janthinobacterium TaxID=2610881 RepID=UPI0003451C5A|nr:MULTISPECIES: CerR family C-terminal domain-containing protein [unclassified Janthinobacterium]MEC5159860.1 AcrR family transcriptional regulator [Janthinobacterium sp. CG_S6]